MKLGGREFLAIFVVSSEEVNLDMILKLRVHFGDQFPHYLAYIVATQCHKRK